MSGLKLWPASYGLPARRQLLELIAAAKADDPLAPVTVITTDGGRLGVLRRLAATIASNTNGTNPAGLTGLIAVSAETLSDLAEHLLDSDPNLSADWLAKRLANNMVLGGVVREVLASETGLFAKVKHHPSTEQSLLRVVKELSDLTDEQLAQVKKCSERSKAVVDLYQQVCEQLDEHGLYLRADVLRQAAQQINNANTGNSTNAANIAETSPLAAAIKSLGTVVLYLPAELKHYQCEFIKALAEHASVNVVAGLTGDPAADEREQQRLCERLGVARVQADTAADELAADELAADGPVEDMPAAGRPVGDMPAADGPVGDHIVSVSDADDEVRWVVRAVMSDLANGIPAKQIAILYPVAVPYERLLSEQLDRAEIVWHGGDNRRLSESVVGRFVKGLTELIGTDMARASFFELLADGAVQGADDKDKQVPAPASAWERIARAANVVAGNDWDMLLERHANALIKRRDQQSALEDFNEAQVVRLDRDIALCKQLRDFAIKLKTALDEVADVTTWPEFCDWVKDTLDEHLGSHGGTAAAADDWPAWQRDAANSVQGSLEHLKELATVEAETTTEVMCRALAELLNQTVRRRSDSGKGVYVGRLASGVDLAAARVYVLGMTEGMCPVRQRPNNLIAEDERQLLDGALDTTTSLISKQHHALLAVLAAGKSHQGSTTLLYPRGDLRNSSRNVPSRWLLDTAKALGQQPDQKPDQKPDQQEASLFADGYLDEENLSEAARDESIAGITASASFPGGLLATEFPATRQEYDAAELLAAVAKKPNPVVIVSKHQLCQPGGALAQSIELVASRLSREFTRFDGNLGKIKNLEELARRALDKPISASALQDWAACPRAFLFKRLLGVSPIEEPEQLLRMGPLERGNVVHKAIDKFLKNLLTAGERPGPARDYTEADVEALDVLVEELLDEQAEAGLGGHPFYADLDRQQVKADMAELFGRDVQRAYEKHDFVRGEIVASEHRFGLPALPDTQTDAQAKPAAAVEYALPSGDVLKLRGSIDRVELVRDSRDQLVVIDYKTGSAKSYKNLALDPTLAGTKLQLAIYAIAATEHFKSVPGFNLDDDWSKAVSVAAYWFITKSGGWEAAVLTPGAAMRESVDWVLERISYGIRQGVFPAHPPPSESPGNIPCPYCSPDEMSTRDLRKQWDKKCGQQPFNVYALLAEPDDS